MEKSCPEKEGHPPSRVNFSKCLYEKKVDPFAQANSACLALTELNRLGEPKCLHGEMLARLRGWPYHWKRVTWLGRSPFQPSQLFISHVNGSPSFVRKCRKSWLALRVAWVGEWPFYPGQLFSMDVNGALMVEPTNTDIFARFLSIQKKQTLQRIIRIQKARVTIHFSEIIKLPFWKKMAYIVLYFNGF